MALNTYVIQVLIREAYVFNTDIDKWRAIYSQSFLNREDPNIIQTMTYYSKQFEALGLHFEPPHEFNTDLEWI